MSGIVGIVNRDGTPVDPDLLRRMTDALRNAGPDGQRMWLDGAVGLGHASLTIPRGAPAERQPLSLDGRTWIVACGRIDGRAELVRQLTARGCDVPRGATDAALVLHAYGIWGESCVRHLLGDFAFAIWDAERRRLFCARDQFGIKPLFYAEGPGFLVFSSSLDCLRRHPGVSSALDEQAIVDFLGSGSIQDPAATSFAQVRRLLPAHGLLVDERVRVMRYWRLPVDGEVRYPRGGDYVEHFVALLEQAVADRLRARAVGVLMSGGLDSTTVAAIAKRRLSRDPAPFDLRAYTTVCQRVVRDPEPRYAALAADALGIPLHARVVDAYEPFERWDQPRLRRPEPEADPLLALHADQLDDAAAHGRVLLTGHGADPALRLPVSYALELLKRREIGRLMGEVGRYVVRCRRLPPVRVGTHVRRWLGRHAGAADGPPEWLRGSPPRPREMPTGPEPVHATRPDAYALLTSPEWAQIFEIYDANVTGVAVDVRHPFFDRRLVEYLLAIPPMPWCFDKTIIRLAMRGILPDAVRLRPKSVAAGEPLVALLQAPGSRWVDTFAAAPALDRYVDRSRVPRVCGERDPSAIWRNLRPLCLDYWLRAHTVARSSRQEG